MWLVIQVHGVSNVFVTANTFNAFLFAFANKFERMCSIIEPGLRRRHAPGCGQSKWNAGREKPLQLSWREQLAEKNGANLGLVVTFT
ncbi:hypothetical protein [Pseudoduganella namucuonensis]|uniref:hypothetical protein n=1 Tax=Pseudoduganella namucuonensis TaxID=1035707 RepID=UPI001160CFA0|nr:hypothetical protein [Pseudoduganella namucuonensis]